MSGAQFGPLWTELKPVPSQKSLDVLEKLGFERAAPVQVISLFIVHESTRKEGFDVSMGSSRYSVQPVAQEECHLSRASAHAF